MPIKSNRVYRSFTDFGFAQPASDDLVLYGVPVVFDSPAVVYENEGVKYYEVIDRHAFDGADTTDFLFNFNHSGRVYARTKNGSLEFEITDKGLECDIHLDPEDVGHMELYRDIKSGLIDKMSFAFSIAEGGSTYDSATRTRTITKVQKLFDVAAVDFPAYEATTITARSFFAVEYAKELLTLEQRRRLLLATAFTYL